MLRFDLLRYTSITKVASPEGWFSRMKCNGESRGFDSNIEITIRLILKLNTSHKGCVPTCLYIVCDQCDQSNQFADPTDPSDQDKGAAWMDQSRLHCLPTDP